MSDTDAIPTVPRRTLADRVPDADADATRIRVRVPSVSGVADPIPQDADPSPRGRRRRFYVIASILATLLLAGGLVAWLATNNGSTRGAGASSSRYTAAPISLPSVESSDLVTPSGDVILANGATIDIIDPARGSSKRIVLPAGEQAKPNVVAMSDNTAFVAVRSDTTDICPQQLVGLDLASMAARTAVSVPHGICDLAKVGGQLAAAGIDGWLTILDGVSGAVVSQRQDSMHLTNPAGARHRIEVSPSGTAVVVFGAGDPAVAVWPVDGSTGPRHLRPTGSIVDFDLSLPGDLVYVGAEDPDGGKAVVTAFHITDGSVVWSASAPGRLDHVRTVGEAVAVQGFTSKQTYIEPVDARTGKASAPISIGRLPRILADRTHGILFLRTGGSPDWTTQSLDLSSRKLSPVYGSGVLAAISLDGSELVEQSTETGDVELVNVETGAHRHISTS